MTDPIAQAVIDEAGRAARNGYLPATMLEFFGEPISVYTRAQAIADGALIDVTDTAREAGFTIPVAITSAVHTDAVAWSQATEDAKPHGTGQDEAGRLWDLLWMARVTAARNAATSTMTVEVLRVPAEGPSVRPVLTRYLARISGGDHAEPVLTIMLTTED